MKGLDRHKLSSTRLAVMVSRVVELRIALAAILDAGEAYGLRDDEAANVMARLEVEAEALRAFADAARRRAFEIESRYRDAEKEAAP